MVAGICLAEAPSRGGESAQEYIMVGTVSGAL